MMNIRYPRYELYKYKQTVRLQWRHKYVVKIERNRHRNANDKCETVVIWRKKMKIRDRHTKSWKYILTFKKILK